MENKTRTICKLKLNNKNRTSNNKNEKATKMKTTKILMKIKEWKKSWRMTTKTKTIKRAKTIMTTNRITVISKCRATQTNKMRKNKM
jgi:hypothetical protein